MRLDPGIFSIVQQAAQRVYEAVRGNKTAEDSTGQAIASTEAGTAILQATGSDARSS